jgi:uracil-DNA glycosylase family 4
MDEEFDPVEIARIVAEALQDQSILPLSFIETDVFERLPRLLSRYMNSTDVMYMMGELKEEFFSGFTKLTSQKLYTIVHNCRKCPMVQHPPVLPSWNTSDPDLMIVAENPTSVGDRSSMLTRALKEAGFSSQRCVLTYLTRCSVYKPDHTVVKNCLPYLHTEIAVLNPKLIVTLGMSPYVALTGDDVSKLGDVKGSIIHFGPYAVLPEASLAAGEYMQQKSQSMQSSLDQSLLIAHQFLYGG